MRVPIYKRLMEARDNPNADLHKLTTDILALLNVSKRYSEQDMDNAYDKGFKDGKLNDLRGSIFELL